MRDPARALGELPQVRRLALYSGYPEVAVWVSGGQTNFAHLLSAHEEGNALAQAATRLAENLGVANQILAASALCDAFACERNWQSLLDAAQETFRLIQERGALRSIQPSFFVLIGIAQLELGKLEAGRAAAQQGVAFIRESKFEYNPRSYAVLARAQLSLGEQAANITSTLDEYAALLERTEFHLLEGEMHELRARLAERECRGADHIASLQRALDCYTRMGMTLHAARVKELIG
jgi:hypothetical protein